MRAWILRPEQLPAALLLITLALAGCTTVPSDQSAPHERTWTEEAGGFSHVDFDSFLRRHVDSQGRIDYASAQQDRADLDAYRDALAETSPDRDPHRFPTEASKLAYWLNAYNASVIGLVLDHYPIGSVHDVRAPWLLRFLPRGAGFFVFRQIELGGDKTQLYFLENSLIRKRYKDARIHFALNCASASCPRLPAEAFVPERIAAQLEREARRFLEEPRNLLIDEGQGRISVSSIFDWYESDFAGHVTTSRSTPPGSLRNFLLQSLEGERHRALEACATCAIEFFPYDWSLNDRPRVAADGLP